MIHTFAIACGLLALAYGIYASRSVLSAGAGTPRMQEISGAVQEGAAAYLNRQYTTIGIAGVVVAIILFIVLGWKVALGFIIGAVLSGAAGYIGMNISVRANVRVADAAQAGLASGLELAFKAGAVTGMLVAGLALLAVAVYYAVLLGLGATGRELIDPLVALGFGASLISIFARLGGGIFTKGADVGADLVGKVEAGIPEDDPRNPAVIADNVGDNVGDCAGMAADLFETYVVTVVATMVLASIFFYDSPALSSLMIYPLAIGGACIIACVAATFFVKLPASQNIMGALYRGFIASALMSAVLLLPITAITVGMGTKLTVGAHVFNGWDLFFCGLIGLITTGLLVWITEYYTAEGKTPSNRIADAASTGAATNIIAGLGNGMISTAFPAVVLAAATVIAYMTAGLYGIAIAGLGMLATTGIQLAVDAYGPIADNAGGLAEMAHLEKEVRQRTDKLDACGNTTAAIGKGFAIGSAALTALALFAAFGQTVKLDKIDVMDPNVTAGLLLGAMMPFLFSAFAMKAVGEAAFAMVEEVRRQFKSIPGLLEGKEGVRADYARCVDISTAAAIRKMTVPALLGVLTPVAIGFVFGTKMLGGLLAGVTVSGVMMALFMSNAGGAWDNAKKHIEAGALGGKGSPAHKAAVVGDTVGDPFKDTAGPSLNILMKLMSVVSLVIAPMLVKSTPLITRLFPNW